MLTLAAKLTAPPSMTASIVPRTPHSGVVSTALSRAPQKPWRWVCVRVFRCLRVWEMGYIKASSPGPGGVCVCVCVCERVCIS